jgi:ABC-type nitrate/sulfonate/bicarbonate transport system substrate-binding protein
MSRRIHIPAELGAFVSAAIRVPWLVLVLAALPIAAGAETKLVLQLHREPQFEFAGYYAALWQGFYEAAGLDVEIKPGAPPGVSLIDPVREITEGRAQFGTGTVQLLVRAAQGQSVLLLAPVFQDSGAAVYYRADRDLSFPAALLAGRVGRLPASNILDLELRAALYGEGIDLEKVKSVAMEPGGAIDDLAGRRVEAAVGSAWELPWLARERGILLRAFNLSGYSAGFYGDSLFTLQRLARADALMVQRFREASIRGWDYTLQHPDEIAARILVRLPVQVPASDPVGFARYQTEVARKLARYPDVPVGHSNPERWARIQQSLINIGAISRPVDLEAFLYEPAMSARRSEWERSPLLTAAGALALLAAAGLLWRQGSRWYIPKTLGLRGRGGHWRRLSTHALSWLRTATLRFAGSNRRVPSKLRPTDLNTILRVLAPSLRRRLPGSIDCRFSPLPDLWPCQADPEAVAKAVRDLVVAAVADMPGGGDVVVGTRQYAIDDAAAVELAAGVVGDYVRLTVKDNGSGFSAEHLKSIFDPTVTVRPAVAAARELLLRFGGFARVESVQGIGTAVHLYFRRASLAANKSAQQPPERDEKPQAAAA